MAAWVYEITEFMLFQDLLVYTTPKIINNTEGYYSTCIQNDIVLFNEDCYVGRGIIVDIACRKP